MMNTLKITFDYQPHINCHTIYISLIRYRRVALFHESDTKKCNRCTISFFGIGHRRVAIQGLRPW